MAEGLISLDGGHGEQDSCLDYPTKCGSSPSCTCLQSLSACQCKAEDGGFVVTCQYP
jgi:hypothetical protein